jgi:hypothetical protein
MVASSKKSAGTGVRSIALNSPGAGRHQDCPRGEITETREGMPIMHNRAAAVGTRVGLFGPQHIAPVQQPVLEEPGERSVDAAAVERVLLGERPTF